MHTKSKTLITLVLTTILTACSTINSYDPQTNQVAFEISTSQLHTISKEKSLYGLDLIVTNKTNQPKEFWTASCNSFINWWIDNQAVLPIYENLKDCKNTPRSINLQPNGRYSEFVSFYIDSKNLKNKDFHVGFSPWQSKTQLQKRALKMLSPEQIRAQTVWSPAIDIVSTGR